MAPASIVRAAALVGLAAACGGDDGVPQVPVDARMIDARCPAPHLSTCDPLAPAGQQGCNPGQKCTWIVSDEDGGQIGCAPDGFLELGEACAVGPPGPTTGFDDCRAGAICDYGACKDICGFGGGTREACASAARCTPQEGVWANCDDPPLYGVCNPSCDPIAQQQLDGTACPAGAGCYLLVGPTSTTAVCARAGTVEVGQRITGNAFANTCVPGAQPRRVDEDPAGEMECGALCAPADVFVTDPADADRGTMPAPKPAALVTGAEHEGGRAPYTCASRGAPAIDAPDGESCRYWWAREPFDDLSPYSNTVGWCFAHGRFRYDSDGDGATDQPFPRCAALSSADQVPPIGNPPQDDAVSFWCKALPAMLQTSIRRVRASIDGGEPMLDRVRPRI